MTHTVADTITHTLQQAGIETVFGLPGGENTELLDALRRHDIRFVLVVNENSAVFMADVTARLTGKPGVCLVTLGPGATNAVAGVAHAYLDRASVLIITAQTPDHLLSYHTHQVIDLEALYTPITKGTFKIEADGTQEMVRAALALTQAGRPGPVHLRLSNETARQTVTLTDSTTSDTPVSNITLPADLTAAGELLAQAKRPVIVVGLGLEREKPYIALQELAEAAQAPVITTPKGKGSLPDDHPLAAGTIGLTRTDPAYQILDEADCIVAVGFDVVELVKPWDQTVTLIWIAPWANEDPKITAQFELVGPIEPTLQQLADLPFVTLPEWGEARVAAYRQALAEQSLPWPMAGRLLPQNVLQVVHQNIPRETLLTTDVGSHKILSGLSWPAYAPNRFILSNGLSCMGFSLPAAIAASLALPNQPTVCITGDAGLAMVIGEFGLLARLQLPVIVVVMNDGALDLIRSAQTRAGKPVYGTEFTSPDFVAIATAYQIDAYKVTNEAECVEAVKAAVASNRPALIEAMIDPVSYPTTPVS